MRLSALILLSSVAVSVVASVQAGAPAQAQDGVAAFYKGKTVTILAGSSAGGGVDVYARLVGRHLGKHIPGQPSVIVQNMPGAGSLAAARNLYTVSPKDGTQLGVVLSTALFDPLMSGHDLKPYDPRRFNYVGNANADSTVCVVRRDAPVKSYADLKTTELVVGGTGPGSSLVDYPIVERNLLGSKLKLVAGYKGSNEIALAIERKELQGVCGLLWSSARQQYPDVLKPDGVVKVLVEEDAKSRPDIAKLGAPSIMDFVTSADHRRVLESYLVQGSISRPFMMPAEVPPERVAAMRAAFMATMRDPELLAEAAKQGSDVNAASGEDVQAMVAKIYETPAAVLEVLRKARAGS